MPSEQSSRPRRPARARASISTSSRQPEPPDGFLAVARVLRPHGVHGEMLCDIVTQFPERFAPGIDVYVDNPPTGAKIVTVQCHARSVTLKLDRVTSRDEVERLRGTWVLVREADAHPLPEGRYYWHQLIGLRVRSDTGEELGRLADILETGSNDVYVVKRDDGSELLLPVIPEVILDVDVQAGALTAHLLPGLDEV